MAACFHLFLVHYDVDVYSYPRQRLVSFSFLVQLKEDIDVEFLLDLKLWTPIGLLAMKNILPDHPLAVVAPARA